jgi:uncharacterized protein VirK/YbjX
MQTVLSPLLLGWRAPELKERVKMLAGALLFPRVTKRWLQELESVPVLRTLAEREPRMHYQIYQPYLSGHLGVGARAIAMAAHYRLLHELGWGRMALMSSTSPIVAARLAGKSSAEFEILLSTAHVNEREGEQALQLAIDGRVIYTASFSFGLDGGRRQLTIGSLQGLRAADGEDCMRLATRELHGTRPSNFMLTLLRDLAAVIGCSDVILVSNRNRIVVNHRRRKRITFDYDAIAGELGGALNAHRNFLLAPRVADSLDEREIPSPKRAAYRRRTALIASARNQILQLAAELAGRSPLAHARTATHAASGSPAP